MLEAPVHHDYQRSRSDWDPTQQRAAACQAVGGMDFHLDLAVNQMSMEEVEIPSFLLNRGVLAQSLRSPNSGTGLIRVADVEEIWHHGCLLKWHSVVSGNALCW